MTSQEPPRCIVVGFDGSPAARAALALAGERAAGGKVFVVHAYDAPGDFWGSEHYQEVLDRALARGEQLLATIEDDPLLAGVDVETELIPGLPAQVLSTVAETRRADEIIVGTRGFGRVRAALGSVAHELLHVAPCPVTAIPERAVASVTAPAAASAAAS
jgi:nucleotide-binding universal stress UspA family protein